MIKLNKPIPRVLRDNAENSFKELQKSCSATEVKYIVRRVTRVTNRLISSSNGMERELGYCSKAMFEVLKESVAENEKKYIRLMIAALYYLCDPNDLIPDYALDDGYLDDALVINSCLRKLRKESPSTYGKILLLKKRYVDD